MQLFYIAEYFYAVSAMFIKISVAVALLRISVGRPIFTWSLYALIGMTIIAALVFCIGIANICKDQVPFVPFNITNCHRSSDQHTLGRIHRYLQPKVEYRRQPLLLSN
jgi:hypothetical protein